MIASPGDVETERQVVREVLHDWSDVNAAASRVFLAPVGWETHATPEMGASPQEIINSRLLKDCDLLIGVFWTRLGTPTDTAESGTVEEIQEHIRAGKPAMLYFSSAPVAPQSIDSEQFAGVQEFKEQCKSLGLIEEYDSPDDFRRKLAKHLQTTMLQNEYIRSAINAQSEGGSVGAGGDSEEPSAALSNDAKALLRAAAKSESGTILNVRTLGGHEIKAGDEEFGGSYGRESARWENALNELWEADLITDRGYKGEVFELTYAGWKIADQL